MSSVAEALAASRVIDLGRPYVNAMPQSPNHPAFRHCLDRRHGDHVRADGGSVAADLLTMGTHVGTHVDALAHVSHDGWLHGGVDAADAQVGGRFESLGIDELPPFAGRGVLLDVPAALGTDVLDGGYEITVADLEKTVEKQGTPPHPGDTILIRSGWAAHWDDPATYRGDETGTPGVGEAGARWLAAQHPALVGADTIAFEQIPAGAGHALLLAHRVLLVEHGVNIVEALDLDELGATGQHVVGFVLAHLNILGGTGAPVRPLALVEP